MNLARRTRASRETQKPNWDSFLCKRTWSVPARKEQTVFSTMGALRLFGVLAKFTLWWRTRSANGLFHYDIGQPRVLYPLENTPPFQEQMATCGRTWSNAARSSSSFERSQVHVPLLLLVFSILPFPLKPALLFSPLHPNPALENPPGRGVKSLPSVLSLALAKRFLLFSLAWLVPRCSSPTRHRVGPAVSFWIFLFLSLSFSELHMTRKGVLNLVSPFTRSGNGETKRLLPWAPVADFRFRPLFLWFSIHRPTGTHTIYQRHLPRPTPLVAMETPVNTIRGRRVICDRLLSCWNPLSPTFCL